MTAVGIAILLVLLSGGVAAEQWPVACGPKNEKYELQIGKADSPEGPVSPGQAVIYFVANASNSKVRPIVVAIDGRWVGALAGNSYFRTTVAAGLHRVCLWIKYREPALLTMDLTSANTYYVRGEWCVGLHHPHTCAELIEPREGAGVVSASRPSVIRRKQ